MDVGRDDDELDPWERGRVEHLRVDLRVDVGKQRVAEEQAHFDAARRLVAQREEAAWVAPQLAPPTIVLGEFWHTGLPPEGDGSAPSREVHTPVRPAR